MNPHNPVGTEEKPKEKSKEELREEKARDEERLIVANANRKYTQEKYKKYGGEFLQFHTYKPQFKEVGYGRVVMSDEKAPNISGYDLVLMSELQNGEEKNAKVGTIYISTTGEYIVCDGQGTIHRDKIDPSTLNMDNLAKKIDQPDFKSSLLKQTSEKKYTPVRHPTVDELKAWGKAIPQGTIMLYQLPGDRIMACWQSEKSSPMMSTKTFDSQTLLSPVEKKEKAEGKEEVGDDKFSGVVFPKAGEGPLTITVQQNLDLVKKVVGACGCSLNKTILIDDPAINQVNLSETLSHGELEDNEGNTPPHSARVGSEENPLKSLLKDDIYILTSDPDYKFQVKDGEISCVDRDRFRRLLVMGGVKFDHKKYCTGLFELHELRGDRIVEVDWKNVKNITEQKLRDILTEGERRGIEVQWGKNAQKFLDENLNYQVIGSVVPAHWKSGRHDEKDEGTITGITRREEFERLRLRTEEVRKARDEELKTFSDPIKARHYLKENERDTTRLKGEVEKNKAVTSTLAGELGKIKVTDADTDEKLGKVEKELESLTARLDELTSIEKRLEKQQDFCASTIKDAADDIQKLNVVKNAVTGTQKTVRDGLIDTLADEHKDLTARINILKEALPSPPPAPSSEQGARIKKIQNDVSQVEKKMTDSKLAKPDSIRDFKRSFSELEEKVDEKITEHQAKKPS